MNDSIQNVIPNTVTHIKFGSYFDQDIVGCIPDSITHIEFGHASYFW